MAKAAWKRQECQYRLELPKLCYHPGWRLMKAGYRTFFHTLYDEKNIYIYFNNSKSKVGDLSRRWSEGSLFDSYYTEVLGRALLLSLDCSTLPLIPTLYYWVLSNEASSNSFFSLWYDSTWDWTQVSRAIGEHSKQHANVRQNRIMIKGFRLPIFTSDV